MFPVEDLFAFLEGRWHVRRDFSDRLSGERGEFRGHAWFDDPQQTPNATRRRSMPGCLHYREEIRTELEHYSGLSTRAYRYFFERPDVARVTFEDGVDFHGLNLSSGICQVQHHCAPDDYSGVFRVVSQDEWRLRWKVTGPRKHYIIESEFQRSRRS